MNKTYIFIDNGVSGSVGILIPGVEAIWFPTPIKKKCLNYTKTKAFVTRIDTPELKRQLLLYMPKDKSQCLLLLERPMINPTRFKASVSAIRALEATLIVLEDIGVPYRYVDSKEWQREMLPSGVEGEELKLASLEVGKRTFPHINFKKDADSLLGAEWARLNEL